MKILLIGVGGVGESIAIIAQKRNWLTQMVLADYNLARAREVQSRLGDPARFPAVKVDASRKEEIVALARKHGVDLIMNACDPRFNIPIFDAAFEAGCHYMDMAMTLSEPHPTEPFSKPGLKLGDYQFERDRQWREKGLLALVGSGVEPGLADVFAKYAEKHLFDEIDEVGVRDGSNIEVEGYEFAPNFSIWTTIEECLNPPVIWEAGKGWHTTPPFSEPEVFDFPEGIGPVECVNVEHEEVLLVPRWVKCKRVTFKYGLGDQFIGYLKMLRTLSLDNKNKIKVGSVEVAPRDVVAACLPDPAHLGHKMKGKTCAGTMVSGVKDGKPRKVYLYQVADNEWTMKHYGVQAVVWQTAVSPVIMMELIANGVWKDSGVRGPEAFDPDPFMILMPEYEFPHGMKEL
ncbi:MAG: ATP-binding protein [Chloroflexi bacterium]|nr:ATP-binding protein [Chloroflexota bacterium]